MALLSKHTFGTLIFKSVPRTNFLSFLCFECQSQPVLFQQTDVFLNEIWLLISMRRNVHLLGIIWLMKNIPFGDKQSEVRGIMIADEKKYSCRGRTGYYSMIKDYKHK